MVDFKFHWVKIFVSFVFGLVGTLPGIFWAWGKHVSYQQIPGLNNYYTLWGTIARDKLWGEIFAGFTIGFVFAYIFYSLIQKNRESQIIG